MTISFTNNRGFAWYTAENVFVKGYFFDHTNTFYDKANAAVFFVGINTKETFLDKLQTINGSFTVIVQAIDFTFVASDPARLFPIFYSLDDDLLIADDMLHFSNHRLHAETEFLANGHTLGANTLLEGVFQLQASEYIIFEKNKILHRAFSFSYATNSINNTSYNQLKEQAITVFEQAFERLILSLGNRPVAIPLSGGYDSRWIACMFKKWNYSQVLCFTYGRKNSPELQNSQAVAKALGYPWVFVEYTEARTANFLSTEEFRAYAHFAGKFSSMPYLQEYFAVKYLKDNKLIAANSVFIPGHSGDFLGGSQFVKVFSDKLKQTEIAPRILDTKFASIGLNKQEKQCFQNQINKNIQNYGTLKSANFPYSIFEDYDLKEKISKFIFNSSSVFDYFGYEHRFPFWDMALLSFFQTVPSKYKNGKLLYDDILKNHYFKPLGVNFTTETQPSVFDLYQQKIKKHLKSFLPNSIQQKRLHKADWQGYKELTDQMLVDLQNNKAYLQKKTPNYNTIINLWYLEFCKEINILKIEELNFMHKG